MENQYDAETSIILAIFTVIQCLSAMSLSELVPKSQLPILVRLDVMILRVSDYMVHLYSIQASDFL